MIKIFTYFFYAILITFSIDMMAQNKEELLQKVVSNFDKKNISYNLKYNLYKDKDSKQIEESYEGKLIKDYNVIYQRINTNEFLMYPNQILNIFNEEKIITILNSNKDMSKIINQQFNSQNLKDLFTTNHFNILQNTKDLKIIEIIQKENIEFDKILIFVNSKYEIIKQKFYYKNNFNFSKNPKTKEYSKPILEILFQNYDYSNSNNNKLKISTFIETNKEKFKGVGPYKNYEIQIVSN